jgi:hypothetical protein
MNITKVIRLDGFYFSREHVKTKKGNKYRELTEATAIKTFLKGDCNITIVFEDIDKEPILITPDSDKDLIKKYLGVKFLG